MISKIKIVISAALLLPIFLFAQNEDDALRYTNINTLGTARFASMGGAMGALGADFGALSTNPASIGLYRRTEFTISPDFYLDNTANKFYGSKAAGTRFNFNFSNIGLVVTSVNEDLEGRLRGRRLSTRERKRVRGWMASSFAIGLNRQMGFQQNFTLQGVNTSSSIADMYAAYSQGTSPTFLYPLGEYLAYETFLIDTTNNNPTQYVSYVPHAGTLQRLENKTKGSVSEIVFSYGANYNHKWYFGGTLGIPRVRYTQQSTYYETDPMDTISAVENFRFDSLKFSQNMVVKGSGINLKIGVIYRASDRVRVGLAIHTPSYLRLTENVDATMNTRFTYNNAPAAYASPTKNGQVAFNLVTPMRAIASAAFILGKKGLVSLEYELVPYGMSRISSSGLDFSGANNAIKNKYALTGNARIGAEYRVSDKVALRGGFTYFGDPYKNTLNNSRTAFNVSTGLGYRVDGFFADFAYVLGYRSQKYYPYDSSFTNPANSVTFTNNLICTLGFRF